MSAAETLITEHLDTWTSAIKAKSSAGRGSGKKHEFYGIKKLRELILELAVRGLLVPQDAKDEPAVELLKKIAAEKSKLIKVGKIKMGKKVSLPDEELAFIIPLTWARTTLGEISEIGPRNTLPDDIDAGFVPMPLISTSYDGAHGQEIKTWGELKKGYTHFANGDIAIAKITPCFENSKAAIFRDLENGYGAGTTELHVARLVGDYVSSRFILLYLKAPMFLEKGKPKMTGSAGQRRIPSSYFADNPLPLPPLAEQHRIVAKVDELMALCDQLEQQQEDSVRTHASLVETLLGALTAASERGAFAEAWQRIASHFDTLFTTESSIDQLKQTILQLAVMGKLVEQDPEDEPASALLKKIATERTKLVKEGRLKKQSLFAKIADDEIPFNAPSGWHWSKMGELAQFQKGYAFKSTEYLDRGLMITKIVNLTDNHTENSVYMNPERGEEFSEYLLHSDDVVMTTVGSWFSAPLSAVGRSFLINEKFDNSLLNQNAVRIRTWDGIDSKYLYYCINAPAFRRYLVQEAQGTANQASITQESIKNFLFCVPPKKEQHRIVAKVDELMALCDRLKARLQSAQATQLHLADTLVEAAIH